MKVSKQETIMQTYIFDGVESYIITRNLLGKYILYKIVNNDYQKLKVAESPIELDKIIKKERESE